MLFIAQDTKNKNVITEIFSVYLPSLFVTVPKPRDSSKKIKFTKAIRAELIKTFTSTRASFLFPDLLKIS